jgi:hypothetical protein
MAAAIITPMNSELFFGYIFKPPLAIWLLMQSQWNTSPAVPDSLIEQIPGQHLLWRDVRASDNFAA